MNAKIFFLLYKKVPFIFMAIELKLLINSIIDKVDFIRFEVDEK